ncbi:MAG: hypothetical protein HYY51_04525 [Candidatus Magasanikbacteria bacterium]|nr:hypothetical protein [Candidatus Magasanikbacteria bacterium]
MTDNIQKGIDFLISEQKSNSAFASFSSPDPYSFTTGLRYRSNFSLSMILLASKELSKYDKRVESLREYLALFLLKEKSSFWSFNYWQRDSEEYKRLPYPDDLDDTFSALAALHSYNPDIIDGSILASVSNLLLTNEIQEGGPYRTWLLSSDADQKYREDVDFVVNINIAYFLSLYEIELPNLSAFIDTHVASELYASKYYPASYQAVYFLSRFYKGPYLEKFRTYIQSLYHSALAEEHSVHAALLSSAMLNQHSFSPESTRMLEHITRSQLKDGSWPAFGFCVDPEINGKTHYSGSRALSTALCLEALCSYQSKIEMLSSVFLSPHQTPDKICSFRTRVLKKLSDQRAVLPEILLSPFDCVMNRIVQLDLSYPISSLPFIFAQANSCLRDINSATLEDLGLASLYGWAAYTAFDDCCDENAKNRISVGIYCFRRMQTLFLSLMRQIPSFVSLMDTILGRAEHALQWEISKARVGESGISIPEYGDRLILADRSLGHALGVLAVFFFKGFSIGSPELKSMLRFFGQHLIARQLSDDMHDVEEDIDFGRLSFVCADSLSYLDFVAKINQKNLKKMKKDILEKFWSERIGAVVDIGLSHIEQAFQALSELRDVYDVSMFASLLSRDKELLTGAKKETQAIQAFLRFFNPSLRI